MAAQGRGCSFWENLCKELLGHHTCTRTILEGLLGARGVEGKVVDDSDSLRSFELHAKNKSLHDCLFGSAWIGQSPLPRFEVLGHQGIQERSGVLIGHPVYTPVGTIYIHLAVATCFDGRFAETVAEEAYLTSLWLFAPARSVNLQPQMQAFYR